MHPHIRYEQPGNLPCLCPPRRRPAGDLIPGSHGLRKLRWKTAGSGKRGGTRVIYYWQTVDAQLWMLYAYAKAEHEDLTRTQLKQLAEVVKRWKDG